jgi:glycosyltransferase involved in cell wall biosynthesis
MRSAAVTAEVAPEPGREGAMRGLVLLISPQPFYTDRGTPIAVRQVLEALSELRYEVDLVTYPIGETVPIAGVHYYRGRNPFRIRSVPIGFSVRKVVLDLGLVPAVSRLARTRRYDFIHAVEEAAFPAAVLAARLGIPLIYDMQSSLPEQLAQRRIFRLPPIAVPLAAAERWLLRRSEKVMSSAGLLRRVRAIAPQARIGEWRFTASPLKTSDDGEAVRAELGIAADAPLIVYTGTFESYQGVEALVSAFARARHEHPVIVLLLVGASERETSAIHGLARMLGVDSALRVLPRCPRVHVGKYVAAADVLVSPRSYGDNIPLKIFDYLGAGRPILATDIPAHRAVLDETRALLVSPGAPGLARGILCLVNDRSRARRLSVAARTYAESHLGWEAFVRSIDSVYSSVAYVGPSTDG